jgi:chemotaxis protein methyltransferase CheR
MAPKVLGPETLARVSEAVERALGLHFPRERWEDLERGLLAAAEECGYPAAERFSQALLLQPPQSPEMQALARKLTVGETYFFRDPAFYRLLEEELLPGLIERRRASGARYLRLWSAGCCTGEEPYSLAILLARLLPDPDRWALTLLATDVNTAFLARAREAVYGEWSLRGLPEAVRKACFDPEDEKHLRLKPALRRMVQFAGLNLALEPYVAQVPMAQDMDLILCRNVLMYMTPENAEAALGRLAGSLAEGGMLALSPVEATLVRSRGLAAGALGCPFLLQREAPRRSEDPLPASRPPAPPPPPPSSPSLKAIDPGAVPASELPPASDPPVPDHAALAALAEARANQGLLDEALALALKAAEGGETAELDYLIATILRERGHADEAVSWLNRVLERDPDFVLAHFALGSLRRQGGDKDPFREALRLAEALPEQEVLSGSAGSMTAGRLRRLLADMLDKEGG